VTRGETATRPILVVGATGLLGAPVARALREHGYAVRLLVRDLDRARRRFGDDFEYAPGSVTDEGDVDRAVAGCGAVHISLAAERRDDLDAIEHRGTAAVAAAAARHGLRRISHLTGSLVPERYGRPIAEHRAKRAAEDAIRASGVPFTLFRPTYFTDTLPRHVQGRVAVLFGRGRRLLHPVTAGDYARMVVRALASPAAEGRELYVHGPEPMTLAEALRLYCAALPRRTPVVRVPIRVMATIDRAVLGGRLSGALEVMALLERLGECGDPGPANALLGAPTTTVRQWCEQRSVST